MNILSSFKPVSAKLIVIFCLLFSFFPYSSSSQEHLPFNQSEEYHLMMGERLYHGLISTGGDNPSCISCHAKFTDDKINWNPSAMEIVMAADTLSAEQFKSAVNSPADGFIAKVHKGYQLNDEQLSQIRLYLKSLGTEGVGEKPKSYPQLLLFLLVGSLMALAIVDLLFTKKIRYRAIHILVILAGITVHLKMAYSEASELGRSQGYMPDQPIKFSHQVHAGDNKIDCMYCHYNAENGKSAGIPGPGLCMNCHVIVREGSRSGKSEIAKLVKHFEEGSDIEWVRVHNLPDHVFFSHAQHVNAGKLDCTACHGAVDEMHILKQENDLSMGWCLDCHRRTNVQFANDYYSIYDKYHNELSEGVRDSIKLLILVPMIV
ncbi:cytochrome c3 family protein [Saccharicrinis fermentans]|uniref:Class III cytochrome C family protein n=1 Tax=Saccharicrinis fermentans DSM 9555 = JCM 21142 TaxID=869213 RepID=W7YGC3_9BACT|nr:cytochrome c3 family protein [Saccharicrinis fermentans]GAF01649.1 class III cytochrome C family protein [Saccharicrinis fermentans DSM 9555 = JCM 21142]